MDEQRQQKINEAAEQFADALKESYRAVAERGASAQELNAELTRRFFDTAIDSLRAQADDNQEMTQKLADQQSRRQEATEELTRQSLRAHMKIMDHMVSYYRLLVASRSKRL
jgi:hypothetical protein